MLHSYQDLSFIAVTNSHFLSPHFYHHFPTLSVLDSIHLDFNKYVWSVQIFPAVNSLSKLHDHQKPMISDNGPLLESFSYFHLFFSVHFILLWQNIIHAFIQLFPGSNFHDWKRQP